MLKQFATMSFLAASFLGASMAQATPTRGFTDYRCEFEAPDQDDDCHVRVVRCLLGAEESGCTNSMRIVCGGTTEFSGPYSTDVEDDFTRFTAGANPELGAPFMDVENFTTLPTNADAALHRGSSVLEGVCHVRSVR